MEGSGKRSKVITGVLATMLVILLLLTMALPIAFARTPAPLPEVQGEGHTLAPQPQSAGCSTASAGSGYKHPLQGITIKQSKELAGKEKDRVALDVLKRSDVQNVLPESGVKLDGTEARVVIHTLDDGNTLLAVGIPVEKGVLIYYELAKTIAERNPDGQGYRSMFKSEAMIFSIDEKTARLLSTSVNGRLVSLRHGGPAPTQWENCGNCTDMYNWTYAGSYCASMDTGCAFRCCFGCMVACGSGNVWACFICVAVWCPACMWSCCTWEPTCPSCG